MYLRTLAGAYAGQIRDYGRVAGPAALRSGTAERIDDPPARAMPEPERPVVAAVQPAVVTQKARRHR